MLRWMAHYQCPKGLPTLPLGRVLVVDEDGDDLEYYSSLLEAGGYKVLRSTATSGQFRSSSSVDFVLVSQGGPSFEGRRVLERAREMPVSNPVLVLARLKNMRCYMEAMQLGAVDYLENQVAPASLPQLIQT